MDCLPEILAGISITVFFVYLDAMSPIRSFYHETRSPFDPISATSDLPQGCNTLFGYVSFDMNETFPVELLKDTMRLKLVSEIHRFFMCHLPFYKIIIT